MDQCHQGSKEEQEQSQELKSHQVLHLQIEKPLCQYMLQKVKKLVAVLVISTSMTDRKAEEE